MGLRDLVLAQVLCVVGSGWVGVAAKLGRTHVLFWLAAMLTFYVPLAAVVIYLNRMMPLEGGLYQWAREGFGEIVGFLGRLELMGIRRGSNGRDYLRSADRSVLHGRCISGMDSIQQSGNAIADGYGNGRNHARGDPRIEDRQVAAQFR